MENIVKLYGTVGWDFTGSSVREELATMSGDITLQIESSGGSVFHGLSIFNAIKEYKKANNATVVVQVGAICASMATYIAMVGDIIEVNDNSVFMIHNAWNYVGGDHNEMRKNADILENLSNLSANVYAKQTAMSIEEIKAMMDKETWMYGEEIVTMKFAHNLISVETEDTTVMSKDAAVALAQEDFKATMSKSIEVYGNETLDERLVAMVTPNSKQEKRNMDEEMKQALEADRARVADIFANIPMSKITPEVQAMIADGKNVGEIKAFLFDNLMATEQSVADKLNKEIAQDLVGADQIDGDSLDEKAKEEAVKLEKISMAMKAAEDINKRINGAR